MNVEPANVHQVLAAAGGRFVDVHADVGGVVDALQKIDPGFGVRFPLDAKEPYWHVYWQSEDGRHQELVMSVQAFQNSSGTWEGLDMRVVERVLQIGHSSYDYAAEVQARNERAAEAADEAASEGVREGGEEMAFAIRRDLGYKGRAFIP